MKIQTLKGFRDFLPKEAKKRQWLIETLRSVFESYGFEPLETPALEYEEVLLGKYGEEGDKLMYRFKDLGRRKVALRYDQTVPLARVVTQYQNDLPMPFKRHQIQNVWRAENTQKGRYREFLQCDIDIVGSNSVMSDIDILYCVDISLRKLGFNDFTFLINSREILKKSDASSNFMRILDKQDKLDKDVFLKLLSAAAESDRMAYAYLKNSRPQDDPRLGEIFKNKDLNLSYMPTLARGLDYYTGMIFEIKIPKYKGGSIGGGGRYDNLIGMFAGRQIPAVGFAFGFDRLMEAMEIFDLFPKDISSTKALVTILNNKDKSLEIYKKLKDENISCELYLNDGDKLEKQLKYADKKSIPYSLIVDEDNIALKDMRKREQQNLSLKEVIEVISKT